MRDISLGIGSSMVVESMIVNCQRLLFDWNQVSRSQRLQKNLVVDIIKRGFKRQDGFENRRPITNKPMTDPNQNHVEFLVA